MTHWGVLGGLKEAGVGMGGGIPLGLKVPRGEPLLCLGSALTQQLIKTHGWLAE